MSDPPRLDEIYEALIANNHLFDNPSTPGMCRPVNIDKIYVETKIKYSPNQQSEESSSTYGMLSGARILGVDAIKENKKLIVRGKPGSGKTTFLRHLSSCRKVFLDINRLPVLVRLKDFSHNIRQSGSSAPTSQLTLEDYIQDILRIKGIERVTTEKIVNDGMALFLLDGVDEMARVDVDKVVSFTRKFNHNRFVISCRSASIPLDLTEFVEVQITDFDHKQAKEFLKNFIGANPLLTEANGSGRIPSEAIAQIHHLITQMEERRENYLTGAKQRRREEWIEKFVQTPLLLTMLCEVIMSSNQVPLGLLDLYDKSVELLLSQWDNDRNITRAAPVRFLPESRRDFLSKIAYELHSREQATISKEEIQSIVEPGLL